jgi:hypothetical protein
MHGRENFREQEYGEKDEQCGAPPRDNPNVCFDLRLHLWTCIAAVLIEFV